MSVRELRARLRAVARHEANADRVAEELKEDILELVDSIRESERARGAAVAFGLMGMADAIQARQAEKDLEAFEEMERLETIVYEERMASALRREREAWKYARRDDGDGE